MIFIIIGQLTALALSMTMSVTSLVSLPQVDTAVDCSAKIFTTVALVSSNKLSTPQIEMKTTYGDKIEILLNNASSYEAGTVFQIFVSDNLSKIVGLSQLEADDNMICLYHNGKYFKPSTLYSIKVKALCLGEESDFSDTVKAETKSETYYCIDSGTQLYEAQNKKMVKSYETTERQSVVCQLSNAKGTLVSSLSADVYSATYIKITEGDYAGKYVKLDGGENVYRISESEAKRRIVSDYGASMDGGRYVWGGTSFKATDCSGLTMQSYAQIGMNISHSVRTQATLGTAVSLDNMKPGDILVLNNYSHVAMYIGNGQMVHAMNSYDGIQIQSLSYLQYYTVNTVRRLI